MKGETHSPPELKLVGDRAFNTSLSIFSVIPTERSTWPDEGTASIIAE
jgi:hypothetical protein